VFTLVSLPTVWFPNQADPVGGVVVLVVGAAVEVVVVVDVVDELVGRTVLLVVVDEVVDVVCGLAVVVVGPPLKKAV
jgi:hypothetical protein